MRRLAVLLVLLAPASARADDWRLGASLGAGLTAARFAWEGPSAPFAPPGQPEPPVMTLELSDVASFLDVAATVRATTPVGGALLLGAELEGTVSFALPDDARLGWTSYSRVFGATASVIAIWPRDGGWRWMVSGGAAVATFGGSRLLIGAEDNVADFERVFGPALRLGLGNARAVFELRAALLLGEHLSYLPVTLNARVLIGQ